MKIISHRGLSLTLLSSRPHPAMLLLPLLGWSAPAGARPAPAATAATAVVAPQQDARRLQAGPPVDAEIIRTAYGVPHIRASSLEEAAFALAWVQLEDYGARVVRGLVEARGEMGRQFGPDSVGGDFAARRVHARAVEAFATLDADTRSVYRGFAAGVNRFMELHPDLFGPDVLPGGVPRFAAADVLARDVVGYPSESAARSVLRRVERDGVDAVLVHRRVVGRGGGAAEDAGSLAGGDDSGWRMPGAPGRPERPDNPGPRGRSGAPAPDGPPAPDDPAPGPFRPDPGSNAWALGPSRTASGHPILLRNPHLSWDAGYYEAHVTVPGVLDFYGDFRIGGPFGIIGGFNRRLGWATTNNGPDREEVYALRMDPDRPDHVLLDGGSVPLARTEVEVEVRSGDALTTERELFWDSPLGPVVGRSEGWAFVVKSALAGEVRLGAQFLAMMKAASLEEWMDAMRMHARVASNFTYADADGHIAYVWNAATPATPHPPGGDTVAFVVERTADAWTELVPWDSLPRIVDPPSGILHNENDPFHYTDPTNPFDPERFPRSFPAPELGLRSQHSLELIQGDARFSLEEVMDRKHSYRMLLAERVLDDLLAAASGAAPDEDRARAVEVLRTWDRTVAAESSGGVLFRAWWDAYVDALEDRDGNGAEPFARPWSPDEPRATPRGLADPALGVEVLSDAVEEVTERFGAADVSWGEVHRARIGDRDLPVGGCNGGYGCFRVLWYTEADDGRLQVRGGDGWVLAVEFGPEPRARSILAYGQSPHPEHPHCCDQLDMFVRGETKEVAFSPDDVEARALHRYRPGVERSPWARSGG